MYTINIYKLIFFISTRFYIFLILQFYNNCFNTIIISPFLILFCFHLCIFPLPNLRKIIYILWTWFFLIFYIISIFYFIFYATSNLMFNIIFNFIFNLYEMILWTNLALLFIKSEFYFTGFIIKMIKMSALN